MLSHISDNYDNNVVLHHLPVFRISFTQRLTFRGHPTKMHPSFTSDMNNLKRLHAKSFMTRE